MCLYVGNKGEAFFLQDVSENKVVALLSLLESMKLAWSSVMILHLLVFLVEDKCAPYNLRKHRGENPRCISGKIPCQLFLHTLPLSLFQQFSSSRISTLESQGDRRWPGVVNL